MQEVKASVLAVEAGYALLFDRDSAIQAADAAGIIVVGVTEKSSGELIF